MIGAIAGDIVGSRFEGDPAPPPEFELFHPRCAFTDDTVCALAVAEALMGSRDFAAALRSFVRRHPGRGYGGMFFTWAQSDGAPAYGSWGNGAPMRVAAVGWLATDEAEADALAKEQAIVTHDHPDAVKASQAVARGVLLARHGVDPASIQDRLERAFGYDLDPRRALDRNGFDVSAAGTAPPALAAALSSESWEDAVRTVIGLGGDADTLACIAGAVAEAVHGVPAPVADRARKLLTEDLRRVLDRFDERRASS